MCGLCFPYSMIILSLCLETKRMVGADFESTSLDQTPPRREFKLSDPKINSNTLLELQLTPSSLFYIKFSDENLNQPNQKPPLLPDLLARAEDLPPPPGMDPESTSTANSGPSVIEKGKQKLDDVLKSGAKAPKWLQNLSKRRILFHTTK